MKLSSYPKYKSGRMEWLGDVPDHWLLGRVKNGFDLQLGKMLQPKQEDPSEIEVSYLRAYNVGWERVHLDDIATMWANPKEVSQFAVVPGDLLVCEGGEAGRAAIMPDLAGPMIIQNALHRVRGKAGIQEKFLLYLLQVATTGGWLEVLCNKATIVHFTGDKLANLAIAYPPRAEADRIVEFLDQKTAKIDALISEQRTLHERLKEKRVSTIHKCVTKGLDPSVPMVSSGKEWIGEVPKHWKVKKIKQVARLESGHTPSRQHPEWWIPEECTVPWISLTDVNQFREDQILEILETNEKVSPIGLENSSARLLPAGTVVVSRTASVGFSVVMGTDMATTQDFANWVCSPEILPNYLLFAFRSMREDFRRLIMGSTHQTIYMPDIAAFTTPVPPATEQALIIEHIQSEVGKIDSLLLESENSIALLLEHRSALIAAVVTGKVDVRDAVKEPA